MKKVPMAAEGYETPRIATIQIEARQCLAASSNLEDMEETPGEWAAL